MSKSKSNYTYTIDGNVIFIEDLDGAMSVTNNVENVLQEISKEMESPISNFKVIYRDTDGNIDGISTEDGKFKDFYPIGERSYYAAKLKIK